MSFSAIFFVYNLLRQLMAFVKRLSNLRHYPGKHLRVVAPVPGSSLFAFFNFFKGLIGAGESTSFRAALASSQPAPGTANFPALLPRKPLCFSMTAKNYTGRTLSEHDLIFCFVYFMCC